MAAPTETLWLSADTICTRYDISRSTLDRWRRKQPVNAGDFAKSHLHGLAVAAAGITPFPEPSFIGGQARWTLASLIKWEAENINKKAPSRGFLGRDDD